MTFCKICKALIRTGDISKVKQLKQSSFLYIPVCNECATKEDFDQEGEHYKELEQKKVYCSVSFKDWEEIRKKIEVQKCKSM